MFKWFVRRKAAWAIAHIAKGNMYSVPRSGTIARGKNNYEALSVEYINSVAAG